MLPLILIITFFLAVLYSLYKIFFEGESSSASGEESSDDPSSSSASASDLTGTYDVFLSFRGEDTRNGFVSHLYRALLDRSIHTFRDDDRLKGGTSIKEELPKAIKDSKIAIVVFSENYADSSWCLDELVQIVEAELKKIVIPVFYHVDPSAIRNQKSVVAKALAKLRTKRRNIYDNRIKSWKKALTEAADFKGWDLSESKLDESKCIQEIVARVHDELSARIPSTWKDLVGIEKRVNKVLDMLKVGESDKKVIIVGIWGMGGAGKTTTARATFDKLSPSFDDGSCFLENPIGKCSEKGLVELQKTLLSEILKLKPDEIHIQDTGKGKNMIGERFRFKKILIVLDNVSDKRQLKALAPEPECFGPGSRVIITTRDNQMLTDVDASYEIELLNGPTEAMKLFSWHAFDKAEPEKDFVEVSRTVVEYAKGLPLALKVLGSHLNGLYLDEWSSEIRKLEDVPDREILSTLRISYDGLHDIDKSIYLDVACFFRGMKATHAIKILDSFESYHKGGISILKRKSLVFVDKNNLIEMHDLVQEMGRNIARKEHPCSRIWEADEINDVLNGEGNCEAVQAIWQYSRFEERVCVRSEALKRMKRLRLLQLENWDIPDEEKDWGSPPDCLSKELEYLRWDYWPWHSLPASFERRKLATLIVEI